MVGEPFPSSQISYSYVLALLCVQAAHDEELLFADTDVDGDIVNSFCCYRCEPRLPCREPVLDEFK
ncbi:hypothetical protein AQI70_06330 [Streptomyces curacoi]|uniref:Uncharacterized protein n=1 Tax=Streptomyces curacoi TaxID=146536 RepID=A0A124H5X6_9ACTN|nr:hypothetical protein AQI70_06330 [Streptomyces curacoi]